MSESLEGRSPDSQPSKERMNAGIAKVAHALHVLLKTRHIKTILRLNKIGSGGDFLGQPLRSPLERWGERIGRSTQKELRWRRQLASTEKHALIAHDACGLQQLNRIKIEDTLCFRLVTSRDIVASDAEHIAHAHRRRAEQIALNSNAVPITACHLKDGFIACTNQQGANRHARHVAMRPRRIHGVNAVTDGRENYRGAVDVFGIGAVRSGSPVSINRW